ncbi:MAG: DNA primase [Patescibacteria group bacterium]
MSGNVDQIKERLSIVDVVGSYVKLEKAGSNYKARCPFHNEKTPSFFVSPDRNSFYCFGCQVKGDIFSFVEQFEGLDFVGALKVLAQKAGVTLERENPKAKSEKDRLYSVLDAATSFFEKSLSLDSEAKEYLAKRGVKPETIKDWRLGFAPDSWRALYDDLTAKGFTTGEMISAGLVKKSEKGFFDFFRGRIMFPIFDSSERVIGFSGRILSRLDDGKTGKYVNSPETILFNKSRVLYGLHKAKYDIRKRDYSIMVEGQMDLVLSHQAGFSNTVAVSGTALSQDILSDNGVTNLGLLTRLSKNIILSFDSDEAGFKASARNAKTALMLGMDVKVAKLPQGEDPADIILRNPAEWAEIIKNSKHVIDFSLETLLEKKLEPRKLGVEIQKLILPYVKSLQSAIDQSHFITKISALAGIKEDALWAEFKKIEVEPAIETLQFKTSETAEPKKANRKNNIEKKVLGILVWQEAKKSDQKINVSELRKNLVAILGNEQFNLLETANKNNLNDLIFEAELSYDNSLNLKHTIAELLLNLEEEVIDQKLAEAMSLLYSKENKTHSVHMTSVDTLSRRKQELRLLRSKLTTESSNKL